MPKDRRAFLKSVGEASLALAGSSWLSEQAEAAGQAAGSRAAVARPTVPTHSFALELDGAFAGRVDDPSGGSIAGVVKANTGKSGLDKYLEGVAYEDLQVSVGGGLLRPGQDWIKESLQGTGSSRQVTLLTVDRDRRILWRQTFTGARIKEVAFPALAANSRDAASITVRLQAKEIGRQERGSGSAPPTGPIRSWKANTFRLEVGDIASAQYVSAILPVVVKLELASDPGREATGSPRTDVGDVVFTVPSARAESLQKWFNRFVIERENGPDRELTGALALLRPTGREEFWRLELQGLGIHRLDVAGDDDVQRLKASLYCEKAQISFSQAG